MFTSYGLDRSVWSYVYDENYWYIYQFPLKSPLLNSFTKSGGWGGGGGGGISTIELTTLFQMRSCSFLPRGSPQRLKKYISSSIGRVNNSINLKCLPQDPIRDRSTMVQVPSGKKPLPEPILTRIYVAIWPHQATMSETTDYCAPVSLFIVNSTVQNYCDIQKKTFTWIFVHDFNDVIFYCIELSFILSLYDELYTTHEKNHNGIYITNIVWYKCCKVKAFMCYGNWLSFKGNHFPHTISFGQLWGLWLFQDYTHNMFKNVSITIRWRLVVEQEMFFRCKYRYKRKGSKDNVVSARKHYKLLSRKLQAIVEHNETKKLLKARSNVNLFWKMQKQKGSNAYPIITNEFHDYVMKLSEPGDECFEASNGMK